MAHRELSRIPRKYYEQQSMADKRQAKLQIDNTTYRALVMIMTRHTLIELLFLRRPLRTRLS